MLFEILVSLGCGLVAGLGGGVFISWNTHRRLLALEASEEIRVPALDLRFQTIEKALVSIRNSEAVKKRWTKKEAEDEKLVHDLLPVNQAPVLNPWDPNIWK
jgi:hypothetical protein